MFYCMKSEFQQINGLMNTVGIMQKLKVLNFWMVAYKYCMLTAITELQFLLCNHARPSMISLFMIPQTLI